MAIDHNLPFNDLRQYVPIELRNPMATSLLDNLFNKLLTRDESVPLFGYIGRKPSSDDDRSPKIPSLTVEREVNPLTPVFTFNVGTEQFAFTVQDLINKAKVLGCDENLSWLYSQGNNFLPPIDIDRFTNFYNYFWVTSALPTAPSLAWNPTLDPEYYTIARPQVDDLDKMNARVATTAAITLTGSGYRNQLFKVTFTSATDFTVTIIDKIDSSPFPFPYSADVTSLPVVVTSDVTTVTITTGATTLLTFNIERQEYTDGDGNVVGVEGFDAGDEFTIDAPFISSIYSTTFTTLTSGVKGRINNVRSLDDYQVIDGVQVTAGDRVVVKNSGAALNGIYVVSPQEWSRAVDFDGATAVAGARVWVAEGGQATTLFTSIAQPGGFGWSVTSVGQPSNTNDWQQGNYWYSLAELEAAGIDRSDATQAVRPIIEFVTGLSLNAFTQGGQPSDAGVPWTQTKVDFNQVPLFDLFRYDGTHAGKASAIFYYAEDPSAPLDVALQRRVRLADNDSGDFIFNHGCLEGDGLLFFKRDGALKTVWHAGYSTATVVDQAFAGVGAGTLSVTVNDPLAQQEIWKITAITPSIFQVEGSKTAVLPTGLDTITVGVPYTNDIFSATLTGSGFDTGDVFTFRLGGLETPRYVTPSDTGLVYDRYGGPAADLNGEGAYQSPRIASYNPLSELGTDIREGTLYSHFRGILGNQPPGFAFDPAFGGSIKLWSEQFSLLAALLMQRDSTPLSLIEFAQLAYGAALNSMRDAYEQKIINFFSERGVVDPDTAVTYLTDVTNPTVGDLTDWLLVNRTVTTNGEFYDTTSPLAGFPLTLPAMGFTPLEQPTIVYDHELMADVLRHHDGHLSPLFVWDADFQARVLGDLSTRTITRSDGTVTAVVRSFTNVAPALPYKGELWFVPLGDGSYSVRAFDVISDLPTAPTSPAVGDRWFYRVGPGVLSQWDGSNWVPEATANAWRTVDLAKVLNAVLLDVEQRLYSGTNAAQRLLYPTLPALSAYPTSLQVQLQRELYSWAALNGVDPSAPNYSAADPFTWNLSLGTLANFPALSTPSVPARWFDVLKAHHATVVGVLPTSAPHVEPYRLIGHASVADWQAAGLASPVPYLPAYVSTVQPEALGSDDFAAVDRGTVRSVSADPVATMLTGLQTIGGVALQAGDKVLLAAELSPENNGVWVVSAGAWSRPATPLTLHSIFGVTSGTYAGSVWAITTAAPTVGVDPTILTQVRRWSTSLWAALAAARPTLRLSVNRYTDDLLPPYVAPSAPLAADALTNFVPAGPSLPYTFGEGSPAEVVWQKSIEFRYSLAKATFRDDPLALLGFCWGFDWVEVDGIKYAAPDVNLPSPTNFKHHGEGWASPARSDVVVSSTSTVTDTLTLVKTGYDTNGRQSFSAVWNDATLGYVPVGVSTVITAPLSLFSVTILIDDQGLPFSTNDTYTISVTPLGHTTTFSAAAFFGIQGLGQLFTQSLRSLSIDTSLSYATQAFRGWEVKLGHRAGGLVATDDLLVFTERETLAPSAYTLYFKRNDYAKDMWIQGLRITVLGVGSSRTNSAGSTVATGDASDWLFRVEGYNPRYTALSYYDLDAVPSGLAFPGAPSAGDRFFRHDTGLTYEFDGSQWEQVEANDLVTFNALNERATTLTWQQPTTIVSKVNSVLPITISGLQNVVTFLYGYSTLLEADGWRLNAEDDFTVDAETGRTRTWQLEIEKLIDRVYSGIELGQGQAAVPFSDGVAVEHDLGLVSEFADTQLFDVLANPAVFDVTGTRYQTTDLTVLRTNARTRITSAGPAFSVHAQLAEYEHLFIFNYFAEESTETGTLYDPFSGGRVVTYKFNGRKQGAKTLRPDYGGHYLANGQVRLNLQGLTDAYADAYNTNAQFDNVLISTHALALLGFNDKDYFNDLDISDKSQFNFWRGLVQAKGTNFSIDAYLNNGRFDDAKVDEFWAYKIAEYGDARLKDFPEIRLTTTDAIQQFAKLQFDSSTLEADGFTTISSDDESRWFSIDDLGTTITFEAEVVGAYEAPVTVGEIVELPFIADTLVLRVIERTNGLITSSTPYTTYDVINGATLRLNVAVSAPQALLIEGYGPAPQRYTPVKLINYVADEVVEEVVFWHPAAGHHTPVAMENVNIIAPRDPAQYNYSTQLTNNATYEPLKPWGRKEVGRTWWNTANLSYLPYYDAVPFPVLNERLSRWGALAEYATVDVWEWVESALDPVAYNAAAISEAGDADLSDETKAAGEAAAVLTYFRNRLWRTRPIAWSASPVALEAVHPVFGNGITGTINIDSSVWWLESGTFADRQIDLGWRLGAFKWTEGLEQAVSEVIITGTTTRFDGSNGSSAYPRVVPPLAGSVTPASFTGDVTITALGASIYTGNISITTEPLQEIELLDTDNIPTGVYQWIYGIRITELNSGDFVVVPLNTVQGPKSGADRVSPVTLLAGSTYTVNVPALNISLAVVADVQQIVDASYISEALATAGTGGIVAVNDAVVVEEVAADPSFPSYSALTNDVNDPLYTLNGEVGWVPWTLPTQAQLSADGAYPNSEWRPYPGGYGTALPATTTLLAEVATNPLTLNNGVEVTRHLTEWADWEVLADEFHQDTVLTGTTITLTAAERIIPTRAAVYVNGLAQVPASYTLDSNTCTLNTVDVGDVVTLIVKAYTPTAAELAFDPAVLDDVKVQRQYKEDYSYVAVPVRDAAGSITSTTYYFWVKNKSTVAKGKKLSLQAVTRLLTDGPSNYVTFQHSTTVAPFYYDAITLSGLNYVVTKDDTFKLRFLRDFTLRDDPEQLNLKNTHAEWIRIRPGQTTKIPEKLWNLLTDALAGEDSAGNELPALRRVLYDERNGTSSQFGFGPEQILAPTALLRSTVTYTVLNTRLTNDLTGPTVPDYIEALDFNNSDQWFDTAEHARSTMALIWNEAKVAQINEIFFGALEDIAATQPEMTDLFKTSCLAAYSIKVVQPAPTQEIYE